MSPTTGYNLEWKIVVFKDDTVTQEDSADSDFSDLHLGPVSVYRLLDLMPESGRELINTR